VHTHFKAVLRSWRSIRGYTYDEAGKLLGISGDKYSECEEKPAEAGEFLETGELKNGIPTVRLLRFCK
jgi:hypothetical protein